MLFLMQHQFHQKRATPFLRGWVFCANTNSQGSESSDCYLYEIERKIAEIGCLVSGDKFNV